MKQLLQCKKEATLLGLHDRAFVYFSNSSQAVELLAVECTRKDLTENPIQAVAIEQDDAIKNVFWCAVSRTDKTLLVYRVENLEAEKKENSEPILKLQPTTVHNTQKRVGCMCFARVPGSASDDPSKGMQVLLAGDFTGDAWALALEKKPEEKIPAMRFLLGHTASMLTGICMTNIHLLTSDRDEKIRVSCFPDTTIIQGFLLGHAAYISSLDCPAKSDRPLCVTCSGGDGTVRVWDYQALKELVVWKCSANNDDTTDDTSGEKTTDKNIPSRVAIDQEGEFVAVIYDECKRLDILQLKHAQEDNTTLNLAQTIECPDQPLGVCFSGDKNNSLFVTMKDPSYLQIYPRKTTPNDDNDTPSTTCCFQPSADLPPGLAALRELALAKKLTMPDSVLEKDKEGKVNLQKMEEARGGASAPEEDKPWNRTERIEIAKERNRRHKRRRGEKKREQQRADRAAKVAKTE